MHTAKLKVFFAAAFTFISAMGCSAQKTTPPGMAMATLKEAYKGKFYIGVAINRNQAVGKDKKAEQLISEQFNSLSPENDLKWERIHPQRGTYYFKAADAYVNFGKNHGMFTIGHTLVWHSQTPDWVFEDVNGKSLTREALLSELKEHINTVVGRYKGVIKGWDVVNEALNEDGSLRESKWRTIIGDDFIEKAFQFAHEADPAAELYYNDYNLYKPEKRAGAITIINKLRSKGIAVTAVGEQGHYSLSNPPLEQVAQTITDFIKAGVDVNFTELDISVLPDDGASNTADVANKSDYQQKYNPYANGLPDNVMADLAKRYGQLFKLFTAHQDHISRITFWGLTDSDSWLNDWPIKGRTNYPLPYSRDYKPKTAVINEIIKAAR